MTQPTRYPLWLDLHGKRVVVVGGGAVASRRLAGLRQTGAHITVISPMVWPEIRAEQANVIDRAYRSSDLDGVSLVLACTDDADVNAVIAADADAANVWCVRSDDANASAAWVPARARVDGLEVGVVGGGDPRRARSVRDSVELLLRVGDLPIRRQRRTGEGRVLLIGGGPGDPDLLTLKAFRALIDADVIVHDRLGPGGILELLPEDIDVIDVGKSPGGSSVSQGDINELLVERARSGDVVARLKGGDPFIFGRGSEELAACVEAGVEVEVIPGLTSATSAPTLAGIPLTERGTAQLFCVVSGHAAPGDPASTVDWPSLAGNGGTLVLLMAVANRAAIAAELIRGGRSPATPVAIVMSASLANAEVRRTDLQSVAAAADGPVSSPAVIVVGDVAG